MTMPAIDCRIFVVGVPRSGTTLVQSLLAAHSTMTSFTESHFFDRHFTILPLLSSPILTRNPSPRVQEFLAENGEEPPKEVSWFDAKQRWALRVRPLLPFQTRPVARRLLRVFDELTLRREKTSWIEKTPRHLRYIPFLENVSNPNSSTRFVHVIRNGMEVVASLHGASQNWERHYDLNVCVKRWNSDVGFSLSRVGAPTDHFVFYEELTSEPEATLKVLLAGLGLGWEPDILERYGRASDRLITGQESWKADVGRSIRRSGTSERTLTQEQRNHVARLLRQGLYDELRERVERQSSEAVVTDG
jgi:hypothetical protein